MHIFSGRTVFFFFSKIVVFLQTLIYIFTFPTETFDKIYRRGKSSPWKWSETNAKRFPSRRIIWCIELTFASMTWNHNDLQSRRGPCKSSILSSRTCHNFAFQRRVIRRLVVGIMTALLLGVSTRKVFYTVWRWNHKNFQHAIQMSLI